MEISCFQNLNALILTRASETRVHLCNAGKQPKTLQEVVDAQCRASLPALSGTCSIYQAKLPGSKPVGRSVLPGHTEAPQMIWEPSPETLHF